MKSILNLVQGYLRKYPSPSSIQQISSCLLKLGYTYSSPFTDSKTTKQVFLPIKSITNPNILQSVSKKLAYNQKGRIQQAETFDSILVAEKHQKILQDDVFGKAKISQDQNRWVYVAQVKDEKTKSFFNKGQGKKTYQYDFGETYDQVRQTKIFVWDKKQKQVFKIQTQNTLIPACPVFSNSQGTKIVFHAYKKSQFGHGLLHCFNRDIAVYEVELKIQQQLEDAQKQAQTSKNKTKSQAIRLKNLQPLFQDKYKTNIFPCITKCFNYLIYCSGQGKTHTHYLDLVVLKREGSQWKQIHRLKDQLVGYYCTLKLYASTDKQGKPICFFQTIHNALQKIYKLNVEQGKVEQYSKSETGQSYAISELLTSGQLLGNTSTHNFNTLFYTQNDNIKLVNPPTKQNFILEQISTPIQGYYLQARQQDILQQFKYRASKRPMILLAHGGPHGAVDPCLTLFRYCLLKMGYSLLLPNFSGSAGFGQKYLEGALGSIGQTDAKQILQLMEKVFHQKKHVDRNNVHVYGGSYGGFMGAIMGSRYHQYFKSAVILNGVLCIPANLFFTDIPQWNTVQTLGKQELHQLTGEDYAQMFKQSPISQPMKIPTLQFLGAKDRRVPYRQGLLFEAMTKRNGTEISTFVYENSAHSLADSVETTIDVIVKSLLFLQGKLKTQQKTAVKEFTQQ